MPRLSLKPRYSEVEHLPNGGMESWALSTNPDGWTLNGGANGTANQDTDAVASGGAAARFDKTASGALWLNRGLLQPLIPGLYYSIIGAVAQSTAGPVNRCTVRLVNVTRSTSLSTVGTWAAGATNAWLSSAGSGYKRGSLWFQVPTTYSDADAVDFQVGMFSTGSGVSGWADGLSLLGPVARPVHIVGLDALTWGLVPNKQIVVTLTGPNGIELDITRRVKLGGIGTITEGAEEEILQITHGDMTLSLDDRDGMLRGLLEDALPTDRWELVILTETGRTHGLKWDRLFAGVLDLPWSVSFDQRDSETRIQAFSYTKALDLIPATGAARIVKARTITITSGTKTATTNSTTDLLRGDTVTARSASDEEQYVVDRVTSATAFLIKDVSGKTFNGADLTLDSYFLRDKTAEYLAGALLDLAGVSARTIDLERDLATYPLAQPIATHGLGLSTRPASLIRQSGSIVATFPAVDDTKRKASTAPTAPFADGATSNNYQADWTPYLNTEPGTVYDRAPYTDLPLQSDSNVQYTPSVAHYVAECVAYTTGADTVAGDRWQLFWDVHLVLSVQYTRLSLYKNGVSVRVVEDMVNPAVGQSHMMHGWIEWDPFNHVPWISYQVIPYGATAPTIRKLMYYVGTPTFAFVTSDAARSGQIRLSRGLGTSGHLLFYDCAIDRTAGPAESGQLRMFDLNSATAAPWGLDKTIDITGTFPLLWTARKWGTFFGFLHTKADGTYISIWTAADLTKLAEYRISSQRETTGFLTPFVLADGRTVAVGFAGGEWFVLSPRLDGVIPYANFTGKSCAGALKDLAIASVAYFDADRYNTVSLVQRPALTAAVATQDLADPLERTSIPIWEFYRTACKVSGTDANGGSFEVIQGADGGSAKTLEVSSPLITTPGMALAVAQFYAAYVNRPVRQEDLRVDEPDEPIRVRDVVNFDDRKWLVTQVQSNVKEREQSVRMFEVS